MPASLDPILLNHRSILPLFYRRTVGRAAILWAAFHAAMGYHGWINHVGFPEWMLAGPAAVVAMLAIMLLLLRVDVWRRGELIFLNNLGHSFAPIATVAVVTALTIEFILRVTFAAL